MPEIIVKLGDRLIHRYFFDKDVLSVGRARDNDIVIENLSVSRNHARIKKQDDKYILIDMNSSNGTMVNGVRITKTEVVHDDQITIGKHSLHFISSDEAGQNADLAAGDTPGGEAARRAEEPIPDSYNAEGIIGVLEVVKGKQQGQQFKVYKAETKLGRAPVNDVRIHDWLVSNRHAAIHRRGHHYFLEDLGSWRGTELNGEAVKKEIELHEGNTVVVGTTVLSFRMADALTIKSPVPVTIPERDERALSHETPPAPRTPSPLPKSPSPPPPSRSSSPAVAQPAAALQETPAARPSRSSSPAVAVKRDPPSQPDPDMDSVHMDSLGVTAPPDSEELIRTTAGSGGGEDEFAPFTDEELEALEADADMVEQDEEEERHRREIWDMTESEKMFEHGDESRDAFSLMESDAQLTGEEKGAMGDFNPHTTPRPRAYVVDDMEAVEEELEEEDSLYHGPMGDDAPYGDHEANAHAHAVSVSGATPTPASPADGKIKDEIMMWEKALKNKSKIIRKNAAKELKRLTGKDYDWQSEPSGH